MKRLIWSIIFLICLMCIPTTALVYADDGVVLRYGDKVWHYDLSDTASYKTFEIEYQRQTRESMIQNHSLREIREMLRERGYTESQIIDFILPDFDKTLSDIKASLEKDVVETRIDFDPKRADMFRFTEGQSGQYVDTDALINRILSGQKLVTIPCFAVAPKYTKTELEANTHLRSTESTSFVGSEAGRRYNLTKALSEFDGIVLMPNEQLSFNKTTGARTYANGYKDAIVISNGEFVKGAGGGVCQASTTLYNSALTAGLKINKVYRHSLPVHYVEQGFDAMVNDDTVDMCFTNNTAYPIYIKTYTADEHAYASIYGADMQGVHYKKVSEKVRDIRPDPATVIPDTEGLYADKVKYKGEYHTKRYAQNGIEVNAYLEKYRGDTLIDRTLIRHETYKSQNAIIYEGTLDRPASDADTKKSYHRV